MSKPAYKGIVRGGAVVLDGPAELPEGTEVLVTQLDVNKGSPAAVLAAMNAPPHVDPEEVDKLMRLMQKGKRRIRYANPLIPKRKR